METGKGSGNKKYASWEKAYRKIRTPLEEFIHDEAAAGLLLVISSVAAMFLANSPFSSWYESFLHSKITFQAGPYELSHTIHHWINDGLMALFFFVVGLEIKREILVGELADMKQAILPIAGAVGGMAAPALIYLGINLGSGDVSGWAIPMATDIAFAVGILVFLGDRVPKTLVGFLLAMAIVDDLGAVLVIALFYTNQIVWSALLVSAFFFVLLLLCNVVGIRHPLPYFLFGSFLWLAMLKSGVHATIAGVLTAITVPARSKTTPMVFLEYSRDLLYRFEEACKPRKTIMENSEQYAVLQGLEDGVHSMESPLQRLEHGLHLWVSFFIIPLFAFANAGIAIEFSSFAKTFYHPVTLGIIIGLVLGKFFGIFGACLLVLKTGMSRLPKEVSIRQLAGVSFIAGIGFTMSIFVAELAFAGQQVLLLNAKTGVIAGSLLAGGIGFVWLYRTGRQI